MGIGKEIISGKLFKCSPDCFFVNWTGASRGAIYLDPPDGIANNMTGWKAIEQIKRVETQTGMTHLFPCCFPESNGIDGNPGDCFLLFEDEDIPESGIRWGRI